MLATTAAVRSLEGIPKRFARTAHPPAHVYNDNFGERRLSPAHRMSARKNNLAPSEPDRRANPPARILVVDDRPTSRAVVKGVLSSSDYVVEEAASGAQALALLKSRTFDLVILDILMPDMDGIAVLREIRALYTELPVIMATVKHRSGDMVDALEKGANDYVTKPIDFPVLFARIQRQIAIKRSEDALRESRQSLAEEIEVRTAELERVSSVLQQEVSCREAAEGARRAREEQFRDFTEVTADWFWEMDADCGMRSLKISRCGAPLIASRFCTTGPTMRPGCCG